MTIDISPPRVRMVGQSLPIRAAEQVATGALEYLTDLTFPDMLHGKVVRSTLPHGLIRRVATAAARRVPGVVAVLTATDVPANRSGIIIPDQPVLAEDRVRQVGDAIALVAAETIEAAEGAARAVEIEIDPLPVLSDPESALLPTAPALHPEGNLLMELSHTKGDVEAALAACDVVVDRTVSTPCQEHVCLEPGGGVGVYENGFFTIWCGSQLPGGHRFDVARAMKVDAEAVRIISTPMGGAFGSKGDGPVPIFLALLAKATERPVRIVLTREEVIAAAAKRHPFRVHTRLGLDAAGNILALDTEALVDTGPYASFGPAVLKVAAEASTGPYRMPAARFQGRVAYTNNGNGGAFRGFGVPQIAFALETALDVAAARLGLDPADLRKRNLLAPGDEHGLYGHAVSDSLRVREANETISSHPWWTGRAAWQAEARYPWRRGTGLAVGMKGVGMGSRRGDVSGARLAIGNDGSVRIWAGPNHSGQFIETAYAQIASDALGKPYEEIEVIVGDTELVPDSGASAASRSTYAGGAAVLLACEELMARIGELNLPEPLDWREAGRRLAARGQALVETRFDVPDVERLGRLSEEELKKYSPHRVYGSAAQLARVEVNQLTGVVVVTAVASAVDCGVAVNPAGVIGQTEGGVLQGIGLALMEELTYRGGVPQNGSLETYLIPTASDAPELETILIEAEEATGPFGAKGIAEVVLVPTAPAIAAAIRDAVGVAVDRLPATPERLFRLLSGEAA